METGGSLHGSAVAVGGQALLIIGRAGSGKTTLALEMIALGAKLVADDRVEVAPDGSGSLWLSAPPGIAGLIEIRGFGLARLGARPDGVRPSEVQPRGTRPSGTRPGSVLKLIADLDRAETERLPTRRTRVLSGIACPVILCKGRPGLAAALTCLLRAEDWPGPEFFAQA